MNHFTTTFHGKESDSAMNEPAEETPLANDNELMHQLDLSGNTEIYRFLASRTESPVTPEQMGRLIFIRKRLGECASKIMHLTDMMDKFKKFIYYGKNDFELNLDFTEEMKIATNSQVKVTEEEERLLRLTHGLMGCITEAGELCIPLRSMTGSLEVVDNLNLIEEHGDILWYIALFCNAENVSFPTIMRTNVAKLMARYGAKFNQEGAIARDLEKEEEVMRKSMEEGTSSPKTGSVHFPRETQD